MRFKSHSYGQERIKTRFLLFPKKIDNEIRWLEIATYVEKKSIYGWYGLYWLDNYFE